MSIVQATALSSCKHCGARMEGEAPYCCEGCAMAAAIMSDAGIDLDALYAERSAFAPRPDAAPAGLDQLPLQRRPDGLIEVGLRVDGLRCASCTWVTERVVAGTPGVAEVTVSYGSGRARIVFDPAKVDVPAIGRRIAALGYTPRAVHAPAMDVDHDLLVRLGIASFAAMNVMMLSAGVYAGWLSGMDPRFEALLHWMSLILSTPVALYSAVPFFNGAAASIKHRVLGMDVPIAIGVAVMYVHGLLATFFHADSYLDSLGMLVALLLVGRVLEAGGRRRAREAAEALAASLPRIARKVVSDGHVATVPVAELVIGDHVEVGAGEEVPADGEIVAGQGAVRMALLTGEAEPVAVGPGDRLVAGALVADGGLRIRVRAVGGALLVERMAEELRQATDRPATETPIDRIAPWFVGATLLVAVGTFAGWSLHGGLSAAIPPTVAVLVVACPCALALAQPLAIASGLGASARRGLLIRSADAFLKLGEIDAVALDKTGTVTLGAPTVVDADPVLLRLAAGLSRYSAHPVSRAIVNGAQAADIPLPQGENVHETPGVGLTGVVDGRALSLRRGSVGAVALYEGTQPLGEITLRDVPRADASRAIATLRTLVAKVAVLTGDRREVADRIAEATGIPEVHAGMDPEGKAMFLRVWRDHGHRVLFIGDGLNDGPALAVADVGIAMASGTPSSLLVADGVISEDAVGPIAAGLRAARITRDVIRSNIVRSLIYNSLAVTAAATGWVNPLVAAVLMPLSSSMVIIGASAVERRMRRVGGP